MSNSTLYKYRGIKPLNEPETTDKLLSILVDIPHHLQDRMWIRDNTGSVCIFRHDSAPGRVIEYVQGSADDSVTTLYEDCPELSTMQAVLEARKELITAIGVATMAIPSTIAVRDEGRGRSEVPLRELGIAQLQDVLAHFTNTDLATL